MNKLLYIILGLIGLAIIVVAVLILRNRSIQGLDNGIFGQNRLENVEQRKTSGAALKPMPYTPIEQIPLTTAKPEDPIPDYGENFDFISAEHNQ